MALELRVTIPGVAIMKQRPISPTTSWPCTTASAPPFQFRRLCGATSSPPTPRLGPTLWRLHTTIATTQSIWGISARVRTCKHKFLSCRTLPRRRSYRTAGSMKRTIISNGSPKPFQPPPIGQDGIPVITIRWSGIPRKKSVARPALHRV